MRQALGQFWRGEVTREDVLIEVRLGAQALHRFYRFAFVITVVFMPWELVVQGPSRLEGARLLIRLAWFVAVVVAMELTRRTYVRLGGVVMTLIIVVIVGSETMHHGGINTLAMLMVVPMLMRAFIMAKREVFVSAIVSTVMMVAMHVWLTWFSDVEYAGLYEPVAVLVTFVLMQMGNALIVYLSASYAQQNVEGLEQGRREFEIAKHYEGMRRFEAEEASVRADLAMRAKSRFLANMSHELRTPLNAILGYAEMIEEELEDHAELATLCAPDVQRVKRAGRHLLEVINDILDLSRLEVEKMPVQKGQVCVGEVLEVMHDYMSRRLDEAAMAQVTWPEVPTTWSVFCDRERTAQLLALGILVLECDGAFTCEHRGEHVLFAFECGSALHSDTTSTLLELRELLLDALMHRLDAQCVRTSCSWAVEVAVKGEVV